MRQNRNTCWVCVALVVPLLVGCSRLSKEQWSLWSATERGDSNLITQLIDSGVNPNFRQPDGFRMTPVVLAASRMDSNIVVLLIDNGADPYRKDASRRDVMQWALEYGDEGAGLVGELLRRNIGVSIATNRAAYLPPDSQLRTLILSRDW